MSSSHGDCQEEEQEFGKHGSGVDFIVCLRERWMLPEVGGAEVDGTLVDKVEMSK
jgi:hypothetical protein